MDVTTTPGPVRATPIPRPADLTLNRDRVLVHRREAGHLVKVLQHGSGEAWKSDKVWKIRVGPAGFPRRKARAVAVDPAKIAADYQVYRPCRWDLYCIAPAVETIHHRDLGFDIDVCRGHSVEHRRWVDENAGVVERNWSGEPGPGCDCPDSHREGGMTVAYCCTHGSPNRRGTELLAAELGLTPDLDTDNEGLMATNLAELL